MALAQSANVVVTIGKHLMAYMQMYTEIIAQRGQMSYFTELVPPLGDESPLALKAWTQPDCF